MLWNVPLGSCLMETERSEFWGCTDLSWLPFHSFLAVQLGASY